MFDVISQQEEYLTYILSDTESCSCLKVVPSRGGIISQWQIDGEEILYLDRERFKSPELSIRGGIPILFPICGNLPDNSYSYQGQTYQLKQHGFARDLAWEVISTNKDHAASIVLSLTSNPETLAVYPFAFTLTFTYNLIGNRLEIQQRYTNNSRERMPFSTGLHPYFLVEGKSQLESIIPASSYQNQITREISSFPGKFDFQTPEIDVAFRPVTQYQSAIVDRASRRKISLTYANLYSTLVFWTIAGKDYVCLEPWSAPRNALNSGDSLLYLEAGESCETFVNIEVEAI
jgi:galactose mutarotase-like enzyme